jgi:hypothetical protein
MIINLEYFYNLSINFLTIDFRCLFWYKKRSYYFAGHHYILKISKAHLNLQSTLLLMIVRQLGKKKKFLNLIFKYF